MSVCQLFRGISTFQQLYGASDLSQGTDWISSNVNVLCLWRAEPTEKTHGRAIETSPITLNGDPLRVVGGWCLGRRPNEKHEMCCFSTWWNCKDIEMRWISNLMVFCHAVSFGLKTLGRKAKGNTTHKNNDAVVEKAFKQGQTYVREHVGRVSATASTKGSRHEAAPHLVSLANFQVSPMKFETKSQTDQGGVEPPQFGDIRPHREGDKPTPHPLGNWSYCEVSLAHHFQGYFNSWRARIVICFPQEPFNLS